jgi:DNA-binding XRE family transcriptional regulator
MSKKDLFPEGELAALAKKLRNATGKSRAEAARELGVARPTIVQAEEEPGKSLTKLRIRMIEAYGPRRVTGPLYQIEGE